MHGRTQSKVSDESMSGTRTHDPQHVEQPSNQLSHQSWLVIALWTSIMNNSTKTFDYSIFVEATAPIGSPGLKPGPPVAEREP